MNEYGALTSIREPALGSRGFRLESVGGYHARISLRGEQEDIPTGCDWEQWNRGRECIMLG